MAVIGTCLNVDDQAVVGVVVQECSVRFECVGTEIEMDPDSLAAFIMAGEEALPKLAVREASPAGGVASDRPSTVVSVDRGFQTSASTWVVCDVDDRIWYLTLGDRFEFHWGDHLLWTISAGALVRLLDRARRAQPILDEHMNAACRIPDDQEIPDVDNSIGVADHARSEGKARASAAK